MVALPREENEPQDENVGNQKEKVSPSVLADGESTSNGLGVRRRMAAGLRTKGRRGAGIKGIIVSRPYRTS